MARQKISKWGLDKITKYIPRQIDSMKRRDLEESIQNGSQCWRSIGRGISGENVVEVDDLKTFLGSEGTG